MGFGAGRLILTRSGVMVAKAVLGVGKSLTVRRNILPRAF